MWPIDLHSSHEDAAAEDPDGSIHHGWNGQGCAQCVLLRDLPMQNVSATLLGVVGGPSNA